MIMDWDKLRLFYHVAKAGSFTAAGVQLNLSQSAVSRKISDLEHSVKKNLFLRHARGLTLTSSGQILFERVGNAFVEIEAAKRFLKEDTGEIQGELKIATTIALASTWLVKHIPDFIAMHPGVSIDIIGNDEELDLKAREADVAIRPKVSDQPHLIHEYLFSCHLGLYASPQYIEKFGEPKTPEELDSHKIITFGKDTARAYEDIDWSLRLGRKPGDPRKPFLSINSSEGAARLANLGVGIVSLSPEFPGIEELNLIPILQEHKGPVIDLYYTYPGALSKSLIIKVFGEFLAQKVTKDQGI